jgi:diguanylate cyclase (GGDEF)-like protein/PAS domain S-box-containing protein
MNILTLFQEVTYSDAEKRQIEAAGRRQQRNTSILIVDDEPRLCDSLKTLLEINGFRCTAAYSGESAIEILGESSFDLMLLDLKMPGVDGHQVMEYTKANCPHTDVIVVSGETTFEEATWALHHGAHDFLRKPYVMDELLHSVGNTVKKRHLECVNRHMQKQLAHSEHCHRFVVNNSPDIIYMLDQEGRFHFVNERATMLLGYSVNELIGKHYSKIIHPQDMEIARLAFEEQSAGKRGARNIEFRVLCKDSENKGDLKIVVEQCAIGLYEEPDIGVGERFTGTYGVIRDVTERKKAEETIQFQLYHDLLTTLPNRALLRDRLEMALSFAKRNSEQLAVLYLDLDGFKIINDSLGHLCGDELLQAVALRLRSCLRESDTLARVGGDEFSILLPQIEGRKDITAITDNILESLKEPFTISGQELHISVSVGIAQYPEDGQSIETLIKNADLAMYYIKGRGKNGYQFFADQMSCSIPPKLPLEQGLRRALEEQQFVLHFQPQQELSSGKVVGVEALIRWRHPEKGMILPCDFIFLAEETGLISEIGEWVLNAAGEQFKRMREMGLPPLRIAVNLSAAQLYREDFVDMVLDILQRHNMPGEFLELEITENLLMKDMEHMVQKLLQLTAHKVRIAVDDFGTGYSSLSYLQTLPLTTLKVDCSFVKNIDSVDEQHSIVNAIVALGKGLDLEIVAEGVEREVQLQYLRALDCSQVQGFLFSPPLPADGLMDLLVQEKERHSHAKIG